MSKVYIVSARRSAIGSFLGSLSEANPADFGAESSKQFWLTPRSSRSRWMN
jgi:acetyl-CoA C-acetyltransferase